MRRAVLALSLAGLAGVLGTSLFGLPVPGADAAPSDLDDASGGAAELAAGYQLYDRLCSACHGASGGGRGPGAPWLWPRPRDFTRGEYKWRSTPSGLPPTDDDLRTTIRHGVPGTSMHAFGDVLTPVDENRLIAVLKSFSPRAFRRTIETVDAPPQAETSIESGRQAYRRLGCVRCHGSEGRGDGVSAKTLTDGHGRPIPPFDLTTMPLRRPMAPGDDPVEAIYRTLVTGLSGTPMPSYQGMAEPSELLAVARYIDSIRFKGSDPRSWNERVSVSPEAMKLDRDPAQRTRTGYWPGEAAPAEHSGSRADRAVWGEELTLNGAPPDHLPPAERSLSAAQCARCHAPQYRQWKGSLHAHAASPGLVAQLLPMESHARGASLESCQRCHAPLAEQLPHLRPAHWGAEAPSPEANKKYGRNPFFDPQLREEGINCASCHVRKWTRHGPELMEGSKLLSQPGYPRIETAIYERSDFCLGCHQLQPRIAVEGRPLLNTYREWLEGPYMRRGIQCQHCHMSNREHEWKGVHDPDTFRQGITVSAIAGRNQDGKVSVRARVKNTGAGHFLPTTPTPAAWLIVELVDDAGRAIPGAMKKKRIGRHLVFQGGFREIEDTRIPPGESLELAAAWTGRAVERAHAARVRVRVAPDDYYEGLYENRLRSKKLSAEERALFEEALRRGRASHYVAYDRQFPIRPRN